MTTIQQASLDTNRNAVDSAVTHTPGSWAVNPEQPLVVWSDLEVGSVTVAEARRSAGDARLIAAAPALLNVCRLLAAQGEAARSGGGDSAYGQLAVLFNSVRQLAKDAVAKTEGRNIDA